MKIFIYKIIALFLSISTTFNIVFANNTNNTKSPNNNDKVQIECNKFFKMPTIASIHGGLTNRIVSGLQIMQNAYNNKCEEARIAYINSIQKTILNKIENFCNIQKGGGIPDYSLYNDFFLKSIGLDENAKIKFLPRNENFWENFYELAYLIEEKVKEGKNKENIDDYLLLTRLTVELLEISKYDNSINILPESLKKKDKESISCTDPSGKTMKPNEEFKNLFDSSLNITTGNNENPLDIKQNYIPNFYQLPVFTMMPIDTSIYKWQTCGCGYKHNSVSESLTINVNKDKIVNLLDTLTNKLKKLIDLIINFNPADLKIIDILQKGWNSLKSILFDFDSYIKTKVSNIISVENINKMLDPIKRAWNEKVSGLINININIIVGAGKYSINEGSQGIYNNLYNKKLSKIRVSYEIITKDDIYTNKNNNIKSKNLSEYMKKKENSYLLNNETKNIINQTKETLEDVLIEQRTEYNIYRSMEWINTGINKTLNEGLKDTHRSTINIDISIKN